VPAPDSPFLTLVLTGRNDSYGGDFTDRFFRTLRFNLRELQARGTSYELAFVEWAPPAGAPLLFDQVFAAVPELDLQRCSWYVVDECYQRALSLNPHLEYLEFLAKNIGIRRARGEFVLVSNCDVFLGRRVLDVLQQRALDRGSLYRAPRHDLKLAVDPSRIDWELLEDPRNLAGPAHVLKPPYMGSATGDFVLLDRQSFHRIRGFNEIYRVARIGIDRNLLVKVLSSGLSIVDIGGPVYHVNHLGSYRLQPAAYAGREEQAHWGDRRWHQAGPSYINPDTWGLAEAPVQQRGGASYLTFDWCAVPPLVDLHRVVRPVARVGHPTPGRYVSKR
jgi:hypothetical protein